MAHYSSDYEFEEVLSEYNLKPETVQLLIEEGFDTIASLENLTPEIIDHEEAFRSMKLGQKINLKKAVSSLSGELNMQMKQLHLDHEYRMTEMRGKYGNKIAKNMSNAMVELNKVKGDVIKHSSVKTRSKHKISGKGVFRGMLYAGADYDYESEDERIGGACFKDEGFKGIPAIRRQDFLPPGSSNPQLEYKW